MGARTPVQGVCFAACSRGPACSLLELHSADLPAQSPVGLCRERLRWGGLLQATLHPDGHSGCRVIESPGRPQSRRRSQLWEGQTPRHTPPAGGRWLDLGLPSPL